MIRRMLLATILLVSAFFWPAWISQPFEQSIAKWYAGLDSRFVYASSMIDGKGPYDCVELKINYSSIPLYRTGVLVFTIWCTGLPMFVALIPLLYPPKFMRDYIKLTGAAKVLFCIMLSASVSAVVGLGGNLVRLIIGWRLMVVDAPEWLQHDVPLFAYVVGCVLLAVAINRSKGSSNYAAPKTQSNTRWNVDSPPSRPAQVLHG